MVLISRHPRSRPGRLTLRLTFCLSALLLATLANAVAPNTDEAPNTVPRRGNVDDARGYAPANHPVRASGGMVVSQSRPASEAGARILAQGGNAIDAAIAVGLAKAVTLPRAGNLGGGGYMVIYLAQEKRLTSFDYYGAAPAGTTPTLLLGPDGKEDPSASVTWKGVAVPGTVAAFHEAHRKYGHLPWREVVQPAIDLAINGVRLSDDEAMILAWAKPTLYRTEEVRRQYFKPDGSNYLPGEILRQPELAWSLEQIARDGADAFYRGEITRRILAASDTHGGILSEYDFDSYRAREIEPIRSSYRDVDFAFAAPPASGLVLAELLNILEVFSLEPGGQGSARNLHLIGEAIRLAVADRNTFLGGPPQHTTPVADLVTKSHARARARLISPDRIIPPGALRSTDLFSNESPDTTHYSVVDAAGNAVSNTYTLSNNFGAAVIADGTGILMNNSLGNFDWGGNPASPNAPAPGKRLISTISPFIAFKQDQLWLVAGTPGGASIVSALAQFIVNVVDFKLNVAEASARPRINATRGGALYYEESMSPDTLDLLENIGYKLEPFITQTSIQAIQIGPDGSRYGSADTRRPDSAAIGVPDSSKPGEQR